MKITVAREKIERVLGTGSANRRRRRILAAAIGSMVARKCKRYEYDLIDLEHIAVDVKWDGGWIDIDFPPSADHRNDGAAFSRAVERIADIFEHPESHPNL